MTDPMPYVPPELLVLLQPKAQEHYITQRWAAIHGDDFRTDEEIIRDFDDRGEAFGG
jgi:hypothetical protein